MADLWALKGLIEEGILYLEASSYDQWTSFFTSDVSFFW